jgi:hypothetical protein
MAGSPSPLQPSLVEPTPIIPDEMPLLYRAVLDLVNDLASLGDQRQADQIRSEAIQAYSAAWTGRQSVVLRRLADRAGRSVQARRQEADGRLRPLKGFSR